MCHHTIRCASCGKSSLDVYHPRGAIEWKKPRNPHLPSPVCCATDGGKGDDRKGVSDTFVFENFRKLSEKLHTEFAAAGLNHILGGKDHTATGEGTSNMTSNETPMPVKKTAAKKKTPNGYVKVDVHAYPKTIGGEVTFTFIAPVHYAPRIGDSVWFFCDKGVVEDVGWFLGSADGKERDLSLHLNVEVDDYDWAGFKKSALESESVVFGGGTT